MRSKPLGPKHRQTILQLKTRKRKKTKQCRCSPTAQKTKTTTWKSTLGFDISGCPYHHLYSYWVIIESAGKKHCWYRKIHTSQNQQKYSFSPYLFYFSKDEPSKKPPTWTNGHYEKSTGSDFQPFSYTFIYLKFSTTTVIPKKTTSGSKQRFKNYQYVLKDLSLPINPKDSRTFYVSKVFYLLQSSFFMTIFTIFNLSVSSLFYKKNNVSAFSVSWIQFTFH